MKILYDLRELCSQTQEELKDTCIGRLSETHVVYEEEGFLFAQGTVPILLVAHLDTVHAKLPEKYWYDAETGTLSSPNGLGADDRCGVCMIFEVLKEHNCSVLLCEDEEIGGQGATLFTCSPLCEELKSKFNYIIEFDRANANDAVFYNCDNPEFTKFVTKEFYKKANGTFSDISIVAPELKCAAVNLSCGYYKAHTKDEYVSVPEMVASIEAAKQMIARTTEADVFEYIEDENSWSRYYSGYTGFGTYSGWSTYSKHTSYYESEYLISFKVGDKTKSDWAYGCTEAEAVGRFMRLHTRVCYADITSIYCTDDDYYTDEGGSR